MAIWPVLVSVVAFQPHAHKHTQTIYTKNTLLLVQMKLSNKTETVDGFSVFCFLFLGFTFTFTFDLVSGSVQFVLVRFVSFRFDSIWFIVGLVSKLLCKSTY